MHGFITLSDATSYDNMHYSNEMFLSKLIQMYLFGLLWRSLSYNSCFWLVCDINIRSMVLRSEKSLKLKMLSLARDSKYVNDISVLSIKNSEEDS